jgi:hypothetical protein
MILFLDCLLQNYRMRIKTAETGPFATTSRPGSGFKNIILVEPERQLSRGTGQPLLAFMKSDCLFLKQPIEQKFR